MTQTLLQTEALTGRFGGHVAVDAVSFSFHVGELTAIVWPNGAVKTTYFNLIISGQIPASAGTVKLMVEDITRLGAAERCLRGLGGAFQLTNLFPGLSVLENVRLVIQSRPHKGFGLFSMEDSHPELTIAAKSILECVRPDRRQDQLVSELSCGDQRKLEVALLIGFDPMVYMFDEPTAVMSVDETPVILDLIAEIKVDRERTVLLIEHKLDLIRSLADRIIVCTTARRPQMGLLRR